MARGTQLTAMIDMLRYELGQSADRAAGTQNIDHMKYALRRTQELLYDEHDWPFLKINRFLTLVPGTRFYSLPADLTPEMTNRAWVEWGSEWLPLDYGISPIHYTSFHEGQQTDPVTRWDYHDNEQIEIWPTPATTGRLRFYGTQKLGALVSSGDRSTLDDLMIVLFTAAELLDDEQKAAKKLSLANSRLRRMRGNLSAAKLQTPASMRGPDWNSVRPPRPGLDYIP